MGQIRKIKDVYYIEFYARGLLYSQIAGGNLDKAQILLDQVEAKIAGGEALTIARYIELPDFFERFLQEAKAQHSPKTVIRFSAVIQHFNSFLKSEFPQISQLDQLTPVIIESYKSNLIRDSKPKVINLTILLLRDILEFGIKLGFINDNPSLHVRLLPWPKTPGRKQTARYMLAQQLLSNSVGLSKLAHLLKLTDISKTIDYANLIPLSRQEAYN